MGMAHAPYDEQADHWSLGVLAFVLAFMLPVHFLAELTFLLCLGSTCSRVVAGLSIKDQTWIQFCALSTGC
jgi:hypothetical protein